jgi:hypothetical protein
LGFTCGLYRIWIYMTASKGKNGMATGQMDIASH